MAKLVFYYGAMNSGKSTALMQTAYNYEERDQNIFIMKAAIDTKGNQMIVSRIGMAREVNFLVSETDSIVDQFSTYYKEWQTGHSEKQIHCLFVDEAQFLTESQVEELWKIAKLWDLPVVCYGLRTDFQTRSFPGSRRLMDLADKLVELETICRCSEIARFNGRMINGIFVEDGEQVAIDEKNNVTYESLCGKCYLKKVKKAKLIQLK